MYNKTTFQWNQLYKKYNKIRKIHNPQSLHILIIQATNLKWSVVSILYNSLTSIIWGIAHLVHVMRYRNGLVHVIFETHYEETFFTNLLKLNVLYHIAE